jgi:hypothetical protein
MQSISQELEQSKISHSGYFADLVGLPSFPAAVGAGQSDFIVYSEIRVISEGYNPDGSTQGPGSTYVLPPPLQILDMDSADWQATEFYVLKEALKSGFEQARAGGAANLATALKSSLKTGGEQLALKAGEIIDAFTTGGVEEGLGKTLENIAKLGAKGGGTLYSMASFIQQATLNPNVELIYRAPKLRQMQFQWKLVPLSERDSEQIYNFVRKMKSMMYPESDPQSGWMGYPARFTVRIKTSNSTISGGSWSNSILYSMGHARGDSVRGGENIGCVLTDMQVEYGEGGQYGPHKDHAPSTIMINMSFTESTLQTRNSIKNEFR